MTGKSTRSLRPRKPAATELQRFFELSNDLMCLVGQDGCIKGVNRAFQQTLGYTNHALSAKIFLNLVHPEDQAVTQAKIQKLANGTESVTFENRYRCDNGDYKWLAWTVQTAPNGMLCALARDVTAAKQVAEELRQANLVIQDQTIFLSAIIDQLPVALFCKDAWHDYRFILWNTKSVEMFGVTKEEALGKSDYDFFPKEQADFFRQIDEQVLQNGQVVNVPEEPVDSKNLGTIILHTIKAPLLNAAGEFQYILGISENITARKQAEIALRESEAQLAEAQRIARLGRWTWNPVTKEVVWNEQMFQIFRVPRTTQPTSRLFYSMLHPDDVEPTKQALRQALQIGATTYTREYRIICGQGEVRYILDIGVIKWAEDGALLEVIGTAQDFTKRRQAEEAATKRAVELATVAQVSTAAATILDPEALLQKVVDLTKASFDLYHVLIYLLNSTTATLVLVAGAGEAGRQLVAAGRQIPLNQEQSLIAHAARTRQAVLRTNFDLLPHPLVPNTRSEMAIPMIVGDTLLGIFNVQSEEEGRFTEDDAQIQATLAAQIAVALQNAQLYQAEQHRRRLAEALEQTGRELSSNLDLRKVPELILDQLAAVVPYERGGIFLQERDDLRSIARRGFPQQEAASELRIPIRIGDVFQQVVSTQRPVILDNVTQVSGWQQLEWLPMDKSWVGVPLITKDRVIGMISLTRREAGAFTAQDATLISAFSGQAAIALENADLYDKIKQFNERLEQMVQQRTEELNTAYQTLERLDQTKSSFIEVAGHELRTPLTVIKGYAQVLQTLPFVQTEEHSRPLLDGILNGINRLHEVVNSMLDVTKIDSQTLRLHKEPMHLLPVIECLQAEFAAALQERQLTLTVVDLEAVSTIQGDPDLLYKVFYHLLTNAIKYTPDGGTITITGRNIVAAKDQPLVEVVVQDTGIGIDPAHRSLIFEKFYQTGHVGVHSSGRTKFKGGGPGLGLAIARGIVIAHGGKIWVESEGHDEHHYPGSRFHVHLPIS